MSKRARIGISVIAVALVLGGGVLLASNMGFKLNYLVKAGDGGTTSASGTNTIALPFNRQAGVDTAKQLMDDIGFASVVDVKRWIEASDTLETYTGRRGTPNPDFALSMGEGYFVTMSADVNYIVAGSHNPGFAVDLNAGDGGVSSASGTNFFAYPYHATASTAKELMDDIGFASVVDVKRWIEASDTLETYTGRRGTPNPDFALVPGESYFVTMSSSVAYTPSHY